MCWQARSAGFWPKERQDGRRLWPGYTCTAWPATWRGIRWDPRASSPRKSRIACPALAAPRPAALKEKLARAHGGEGTPRQRAASWARFRARTQDGRQVNRINGYGTTDYDGWRWVGVDLEQIEGNVRELVRFFGGTPLLAVVKADGYGHGMVPVAHRALAAGAAMLGVTSVDEGAQLRREGIIAPILLLQPLLPGQAAAAVAENLRVCITDYRGADDLAEAARRAGRKAAVHVKVNTGMGRFGVDVGEAMALIRYVKRLPDLLLEGVF